MPPKKLSFRFRISLSDMTNYKSAFGKVCQIKNRQTFRSMPILNSAYFTAWYAKLKNRHTFKSLPILNSSYFTECRFVIRHITQTDTETETEANFTHFCTRHLEATPRKVSNNLDQWKPIQTKTNKWNKNLLHPEVCHIFYPLV